LNYRDKITTLIFGQ